MKPNRRHIPYGRQSVDEEDIETVVRVLKSDWLTTGPTVGEFENAFRTFTGTGEAVAVSSGTAALHAAMYAIDIRPGDEVILPPMTFAATANAVVYQGGTPVFADVCPETLLIDPNEVEKKITPNTRAVIAVDYAGQPCDYDTLRAITDKHKLYLVSDACHSPGALYKGRKSGSLADLTAFSFHPVKHITTGEGGMVATGSTELADRMRRFRNHGINTDHRQRAEKGTWYYEMQDLGYNYRITDFQCALGISQLKKLPGWIEKRNRIADKYSDAFSRESGITPLSTSAEVRHAYHLYVVTLENEAVRNCVYDRMRENNIGVNVHYPPVHFHPFYRKKFNTAAGICPNAEKAYKQILSLPIYPGMKDEDIETVIECITASLE